MHSWDGSQEFSPNNCFLVQCNWAICSILKHSSMHSDRSPQEAWRSPLMSSNSLHHLRKAGYLRITQSKLLDSIFKAVHSTERRWMTSEIQIQNSSRCQPATWDGSTARTQILTMKTSSQSQSITPSTGRPCSALCKCQTMERPQSGSSEELLFSSLDLQLVDHLLF